MKKNTLTAMEFFNLSKIYSDGKNSSNKTVKSEQERVCKTFNVLQTYPRSHEKQSTCTPV